MIPVEMLKSGAAAMNIELTDTQLAQFDLYATLLVEWNQKMNLTAITDPEGIVVKHFLDSLSFLRYVKPPKNASLIDVGTGAGFPAVVLKIARPDLRITLLDSLNKRLLFLQEVSRQLHLPMTTVHARAEEGGRNPQLRQKFDFATARAVAALPVLSEYCLPFVKKGGAFVAMKGPGGETELTDAQKAIRTLGGKHEETHLHTLEDGSSRTAYR
ncbi:MAG: 16S rRNA (guanine(527)-N(7))-methyltransferase RsmG [Clostridia bacterium]|nr:16S rRNA (guanine(527)-N(7))-methyltransferase RsmG [Clostridia bacterium]